MLNAIKHLCPGIQPEHFRLQDDGGGPYIKQWSWSGPQPTPEQIAAALPVAEFNAARAEAIRIIDADTDAIYGACIGNRATEYKVAEDEAKAYETNNYAGAAPQSVASWATAKGWTANQATDDILATANQWRGAQASIRANRLARKEQVRTASNQAAVEAAVASWKDFVAATRAALGV